MGCGEDGENPRFGKWRVLQVPKLDAMEWRVLGRLMLGGYWSWARCLLQLPLLPTETGLEDLGTERTYVTNPRVKLGMVERPQTIP